MHAVSGRDLIEILQVQIKAIFRVIWLKTSHTGVCATSNLSVLRAEVVRIES